jgi:hypothetical protein
VIERAKIKILAVLNARRYRERVSFSFRWDDERYYVTGTI